MGQYLAIVLLLGLGVLFALGSFVTNKLLVKGRPTAAKVAPYECGIVPSKEPPERFGVSFYLVAMLFIIFDIEIVFLYPYVVARAELGSYAFFEILAFSVVFFAAIVYVVAKGGLDWGPIRRLRGLSPAISAERTTTSTIRRVGADGRRVEPSEPGEAA
ncbi:MAG TPA: NADH-quinone oxidoreductase subunit A [Acidimicrobiales bacterium]|jgi:NADH-quinone oxidoreductase subunit A